MLAPMRVHPGEEGLRQEPELGDVLVGEIILKGQRVSTGGTHEISIFGLADSGRYLGQNKAGMVLEIIRIGDTQRYELSMVTKGIQVGVYFGTFVLKDIQKQAVPDIPDLGTPRELQLVTNIDGKLHVIDTTRHNVEGCIGFDDRHESKQEFSLAYLGNICPGMNLSGKIARPRHNHATEYEDISYRVHRVGDKSMSLSREVYNPRETRIITKKYILDDIRMMTDKSAIGTITSHDGKEKGEFSFSIDNFQSSGVRGKQGTVRSATKRFLGVGL